jgi:hypothetical protein
VQLSIQDVSKPYRRGVLSLIVAACSGRRTKLANP